MTLQLDIEWDVKPPALPHDLFDEALADYPSDSIQLFREYHDERPEIYYHFKKYSMQMYQSRRNHYGAKGVMERIRWDYALRYPEEDFKISNSFISMYARLLMFERPEMEGFFRTKRVRGIRRVRKLQL